MQNSFSLKPTNHHSAILTLGKALGYPLSMGGVCQGVTMGWLEANFADEEKKFIDRVEYIESVCSSSEGPLLLAEKIQAAREKIISKMPLTEEENVLLEIPAFYEKILLYQSPHTQRDLFKQFHTQQDIEAISVLAASLKNKHLINLGTVYGLYNESETKDYLATLSQLIKDGHKQPPHSTGGIFDSAPAAASPQLGLVLSSERHTIGLYCHPKSNSWRMMDINHFPPIPISEANIHAIIGQSDGFCDETEKIAFSSTLITTAAHPFTGDASLAIEKLSPKTSWEQREGIEKLLFLAARDNNTKFIRLIAPLLGNRVDTLTHGCTPLCIAAERGYAAAVTALADAGADVNTPDSDGFTPLYITAQNGHADAITALTKAGTDVNRPDNEGFTPLYIAAQNGHVAAITVLVEAGANLNIPDKWGRTPLCIAAQNGHAEVIALLVKAGADLNKPDSDGFTPLCIAAERGHAAAVTALADAGADVNRPDSDGFTPSCIAAFQGHAAAVTALADAGADLNTTSRDGFTPFFIAAQEGHTSVVEFFLAKGIEMTPVMMSQKALEDFASGRGNEVVEKMAKFIATSLRQGATEDAIAVSPQDIATIMGHDKVVDLCKAKSQSVIVEAEPSNKKHRS